MKKDRKFVIRLNGHTIYYSWSWARRDAGRFCIVKKGKQIYDVASFESAIRFVMGGKKLTKLQMASIRNTSEFDGWQGMRSLLPQAQKPKRKTKK